jgi:hypothetical protein
MAIEKILDGRYGSPGSESLPKSSTMIFSPLCVSIMEYDDISIDKEMVCILS